MVFEEQRETLTLAVEELSKTVPPDVSGLINKQTIWKDAFDRVDLASRLASAQNYNEIIMANIDAGIVGVDMKGRIVSVSSTRP